MRKIAPAKVNVARLACSVLWFVAACEPAESKPNTTDAIADASVDSRAADGGVESSADRGGAAGEEAGHGAVAPDAGADAGSSPLPDWPLAIPEPEFGIQERAPQPPDPWTAPDPAFYYVDNSLAAATDDANPQGTPAKPRRTLPETLAASATVFVAGGPYAGGGISIHAEGTAHQPVFVRALDSSEPPKIEARVELSGSYLIVEHLDFNGPDSGVAVLTPSDHVVVRHAQVRNAVGGPSAGLYTGRWNPEDDPAVAEHIVFYDNRVHDNGDWKADTDEDHHGIALGHHAHHVWIVGNVMFHNSGDGLQINAKKASLMDTLHHVFAGGNLAYENKQTGLWSKQSTDVVFSQNIVHDHRPSNSSGGAGIGFQYGPQRLWIVLNEIYACENGITSSTYQGDVDDVPGSGEDVYVIGNLIHDIHKTDGSGPSTDPWQNGAAIRFTDEQARKHVENNTVVDADVGITYARGVGALLAANNILSEIAGAHVQIETTQATAASHLDHDLMDAPGLLRWGSSQALDVAGLVAKFPGACDSCLEADARLVDPAGSDLRLQSTSPAVDSATTPDSWTTFEQAFGTSLAVDLDATPRPQGSAVDRGAYEL